MPRDQDITLEGLTPFALEPDAPPEDGWAAGEGHGGDDGSMPSAIGAKLEQAAVDAASPKRVRASQAPGGMPTPRDISAEEVLAHGLPGQRIGDRYEIEEMLGTGGMGKVFRVRHLGLDKRFALKLMRLDISADETTRAQFYREARVASALAHPNIVSVVDFGEDARLGAFMVMELLEGKKLTSVLGEEGRFAQKPWCDVMLQIAEACHHVHAHRIVHGDIKPDNIMLCEVPSTDRRKVFAKLLDFGLARDAGPQGRRERSIGGTPHYIAPERLRGHAPHPSMDIYSLGVVGFELLTGKAPFDGPIAQVIDMHLTRKPPSFAEAGVVGADETMEALIQRALSKDPANRQKDMGAFLYELRTLMAMLGMGRRRAVTTPRVRGGNDEGAVAALFAVAPVPQAGVDADGRIIVANRAFAKFVLGDPDALVQGVSVAATRLVDAFPDLMAELRHVHIVAQPSKRLLKLVDGQGRTVDLVMWMIPGAPRYGDVVITVHSLPRDERPGP